MARALKYDVSDSIRGSPNALSTDARRQRARALFGLALTGVVILISARVAADPKALLKPTTAMLEQADKVALLSNAIATQFETFRSALDAECARGNTD